MSNVAYEQAKAQMSGIAAMVAALECDYDRLEELRDECDELLDLRKEDARLRQQAIQEGASKSAHEALAIWEAENGDRLEELEDQLEDELEELAALQEVAGDCESTDDAMDRIKEDPLSVEVRSGWFAPGCSDDAMLEEFQILLCTGGPAVRIMGELNVHGEPSRAWLEYQDWGTPWTEYHGANADHKALLTYCQQFYFGE